MRVRKKDFFTNTSPTSCSIILLDLERFAPKVSELALREPVDSDHELAPPPRPQVQQDLRVGLQEVVPVHQEVAAA